jgi:hypothetical protein
MCNVAPHGKIYKEYSPYRSSGEVVSYKHGERSACAQFHILCTFLRLFITNHGIHNRIYMLFASANPCPLQDIIQEIPFFMHIFLASIALWNRFKIFYLCHNLTGTSGYRTLVHVHLLRMRFNRVHPPAYGLCLLQQIYAPSMQPAMFL